MKYLIHLLTLMFTLTSVSGAFAITPELLKKAEQLKLNALELLNQGKFNKAIPVLKEILVINPQDKTASKYLTVARQQLLEPICKQASDAYFEGNYTQAIEFWEVVLSNNPEDRRIINLIDSTKNMVQDNTTDAMFALADKFLKEDRYEQAIREIEKILSINPYDMKAREQLKSAIKAMTDYEVKIHYEKAEAHYRQKRYDLAIREWKEVLKLDPEQESASRLISSTMRTNFMDTSYSKAEKLYTEGEYYAALKQYNVILLDNPTDQYAKKIISRLDGVIKITQKIDKQGPAWNILRKSLSNYISPDGNPKTAVAAAWYAVQLDPDNPISLAVRDFIEHSLIAVVRTMEYPVKDMNLFDQYLFAALNNIYAGRYDLAIQECSILLELDPSNLLALKRLGSAYYAMGKKNDALETWKKAMDIAPNDKELEKFIKQTK